MKAAVVRELGKGFELSDVEIAPPLGREVLIEVKASGLCHSDELVATYPIPGFETPMVLGHEVAGVVTAVGPEVTEFTVGDHVAGCLQTYCGNCARCRAGKQHLCLKPEAIARAKDEPPRLSDASGAVFQGMGLGGFAEQALIHEHQLALLPDGIPWPQAALLGCGVVTGAGAVLNAANVSAGDTVVVVGVGGVGLNAINGAVTAGASRIVAVDIADRKLGRAREFGATHVVNSAQGDPVAEVLAITEGGADAVFDFVGLSPVLKQSYDMVAPGGGLFLLGALDPTATLEVSGVEILNARKRVQGVYLGSTNAKRDIPLYANLYLQGRFELDALVSKRISLAEIDKGYAALQDPGVARVVITDFS